jgi:hypothetical protein
MCLLPCDSDTNVVTPLFYTFECIALKYSETSICRSPLHTPPPHKNHLFPLVPARHPYKQCIIISNVSVLEVSFSLVIGSELLVLTHNMPGMIFCEKEMVKVNLIVF